MRIPHGEREAPLSPLPLCVVVVVVVVVVPFVLSCCHSTNWPMIFYRVSSACTRGLRRLRD